MSWRTSSIPSWGREVDDVIGEHLEVYSDTDLSDHVSRMCLADARLFLTGLNLTYTDRASMAASTEVRVPFVDPIVFQAAFSLSANQKIRGRNQKVALKEAALAWLPPDIVHRPKLPSRRPCGPGYPTTCGDWSMKRLSAANWWKQASCNVAPWRRSSAMIARDARTDRSRSGTS